MKRPSRHLRLRRAFQHAFATSIAVLTLSLFSACTDDENAEYSPISASCTAAEDQRGSFMGRVPRFPVRIRIDSRFTREQIDGILYTIAQWNAVGQQVLRHDLFTTEVASADSVRKMDPRSCDNNFGDETSFWVVREQEISHWKLLGFSERIPGATFRCEQNSQATRQIQVTRQLIYVYDALVPKQQFTSVILHEIGHAVGLDHSCLDGDGRPDFRACADLESNHSYKLAVMYPWLRSSGSMGSAAEIKDVLRINDKQRGMCMM